MRALFISRSAVLNSIQQRWCESYHYITCDSSIVTPNCELATLLIVALAWFVIRRHETWPELILRIDSYEILFTQAT